MASVSLCSVFFKVQSPKLPQCTTIMILYKSRCFMSPRDRHIHYLPISTPWFILTSLFKMCKPQQRPVMKLSERGYQQLHVMLHQCSAITCREKAIVRSRDTNFLTGSASVEQNAQMVDSVVTKLYWKCLTLTEEVHTFFFPQRCYEGILGNSENQ